MDWKRIGKALIYPHTAIMIILVPISLVLLVGSMVFVGTKTVIAYISYALSAYTLFLWCMKIPNIIRFFKTFKNENRYARMWLDNPHLRVRVSLWGGLMWCALYGVFQLWLGFYHGTFWFASLGAYYILLGVMRLNLLTHTRKYAPGERMREELLKYRTSGIVFLVMNIALAVIVFFMVYWGRTFNHHMITAIAMAAYTFISFTAATVSAVKYRKYNSPVFSASKAIGFAAALVSMLTLEATLLTTFGDGRMTDFEEKLMLGLTGGAISAVIVATAIYMIVVGTKRLNELKEVENGK